jgi:hypothetical protein
MRYLLPLVILLLVACKGQTEKKKSDLEKIEKSVQSYFFLGDSVEVTTEITDTIYITELDEMLETLDKNLDLIQQDIDTLGSIIDSAAYKNLKYEETLYPESIDIKMASRRLEVSKYKLKMAELRAKKLSFQQSKRIMLILRRSQFYDIAGYEVSSSYDLEGESLTFELLLDAGFRVID